MKLFRVLTSLGLVAAAACAGAPRAAVDIGPWRTIAPGVSMPRLNLGHPDDGNHTSPAGTAAALELWLSAAVNGSGIDTAWMYHNQKLVGQAIQASGRPRASLFVTTKVPGVLGRGHMVENLKTDLAALGLDFVDLALIHFPCALKHPGFPFPCKHATAAQLQDSWRGMEDAKAMGLARSIGISNFGADQIQPILDLNAAGGANSTKPAVNQCRMSIGKHDDATRAFSQVRGAVAPPRVTTRNHHV